MKWSYWHTAFQKALINQSIFNDNRNHKIRINIRYLKSKIKIVSKIEIVILKSNHNIKIVCMPKVVILKSIIFKIKRFLPALQVSDIHIDVVNSIQAGAGQWLSLDAELVMRDGEVVGTKNPTGHVLLVDARFELPLGKTFNTC